MIALEPRGQVRGQKQLLFVGPLESVGCAAAEHQGVAVRAEGGVGEAQFARDLRSKVQILGPANLIHVAGLAKVILYHVETDEWIGESARRRNILGRKRRRRRGQEIVAIVIHAKQQSIAPAIDQAAGDSSTHEVGGLIVVELVDDIAEKIARNGSVVGLACPVGPDLPRFLRRR